MWFAIRRAPASYPFELQGVAQQWPATSPGIQIGSPARAETATRASGSEPPAPGPPPPARPKIRFTHAGR